MSIFSSGGITVPDPHGAAGLHLLVAVTNAQIEALRKDDWTTVFGPTPLTGIFPDVLLSPGSRLVDPKVVYDAYRDRFVLVVLQIRGGNGTARESRIRLAVSKDGFPPTGTPADWYTLSIDSLVNVTATTRRSGNSSTTAAEVLVWADYPGLAVDEEAVYVTANMFTAVPPVDYSKPLLWIVDKDQFYDGVGLGSAGDNGTVASGVAATLHDFTKGFVDVVDPYWLFSAMPAMVRRKPSNGVAPNNFGTFLALTFVAGPHVGLPEDPDEFVPIVKIDNPLSTNPAFQLTLVRIGDVLPYDSAIEYFPPLQDGPQLDPLNRSKLLETNDQRSLQAVWVNGQLWMTTTTNSGDGRTLSYWLKFHADGISPPTLADHGKISCCEDKLGGTEGTYTAHASLDVNSEGVVAFGFAAFSSDMYPSAYCTVRDDLLDLPGTVRVPSHVVRAGEAPYYLGGGGPSSRWGDYTGMSVDPANHSCFWAFNQYAANETYTSQGGRFGSWKTAWARLCYTRPPQCQGVGEACSDSAPCCSSGNKVVCEGPPNGKAKTCKVCRRVHRRCSRSSQCCSSGGDKVCEGPPGKPKRCKVCKRLHQGCVRSTECCPATAPAANKVVCEGPPNQPKACKICQKLGKTCSRTTQCCPGLDCKGRQCGKDQP